MVERSEKTPRDVAFDVEDIYSQSYLLKDEEGRPVIKRKGRVAAWAERMIKLGIKGPFIDKQKLDEIVERMKAAQVARNAGNSEPGK